MAPEHPNAFFCLTKTSAFMFALKILVLSLAVHKTMMEQSPTWLTTHGHKTLSLTAFNTLAHYWKKNMIRHGRIMVISEYRNHGLSFLRHNYRSVTYYT